MNDEMGGFGKGRLNKTKGIAEDRFVLHNLPKEPKSKLIRK